MRRFLVIRTGRTITIDLGELAFAADERNFEAHHYLDLETGDTPRVSSDAQSALEDLYEDIHDESGNVVKAFDDAVSELHCHNWWREALREAHVVAQGFGDRFISVEDIESYEAYDTMQEFVVSVADVRLRQQLWGALNGDRPFRRFKDVLENHPKVRERWFEFEAERQRETVLDWLRREGIEPVDGSGD